MTLERPFLLPLIERLLGGADPACPRDRKLTEIDEMLAARVFTLFVEQMSVVWNDVAELQLGIGLEPRSSTAQIAGLSEATLVMTLEVQVDDGLARCRCYFPFAAIEPIIAELSAAATTSARRAPANAAAVRDGDRRRRARGARRGRRRVHLPIEEVLALELGDVIDLGARADGGVTLCADDVPVHQGRPAATAASAPSRSGPREARDERRSRHSIRLDRSRRAEAVAETLQMFAPGEVEAGDIAVLARDRPAGRARRSRPSSPTSPTSTASRAATCSSSRRGRAALAATMMGGELEATAPS